jgi:Na+/H+ antiporter NhaD/arsenite permease-like protein
VIAPLCIFAATYLIVSGVRVPLLRLDRTSGALVGAVAMVVCGALTEQAAFAAVNWDTIALLLGMMILTAYLIEARFFRALAWLTAARAGSARTLLVALIAVGGALSALLVNDTVCLMFTPLVLAVVDEARLPAEPYLLGLASATNLGGVASFTGNPQNMIVATRSHIRFLDYSGHMAAVAALGLVADAALLTWLYRRELPAGPLPVPHTERPRVDRPLLAKALAALALVVIGFSLGLSLPGTAMAGAALLILLARRPPREALEKIDFSLLLFFAALFVVVAGVGRSGALEQALAWVVPRLGESGPRQLATLSGATLVGSNVFSNVPWVLLASELPPRMVDPRHAWIALAMSSTVAGNLTIFGSVANMIVLEMAGERGKIGFWRFLRFGAPLTLITVAIGLAVLLAERAGGW